MKLHVTPSDFFDGIVRGGALVHNTFFFSEQPSYRNYSTYKHCNFSHGYQLVK